MPRSALCKSCHRKPAAPIAREILVYLVDDDEAVLDSLRWLLEGNGFDVRTYASAEAFLPSSTPSRSPASCSTSG